MTGHGGWPLNAFLTPDGVPFYAGTYFPPRAAPRACRAGARCSTASPTRGTSSATRSSSRLAADRRRACSATAALRARPTPSSTRAALDGAVDGAASAATTPRTAAGAARRSSRPPRRSSSCCGAASAQMALHTLRRMAGGGIYDQIGGGFARYSVDARWIVPHFEKMLYDNALLARAYLHAFQVSGEPLLRARLRARRSTGRCASCAQPEGGFASALDADSEGVEGKFYVWRLDEVRAALDPELADTAIAHFGMTEEGNFEGANIPVRATPDPERLDEIKATLLAAREQRVRPGLDDKRLTRLERADDLGARRRRRARSASRATATPRSPPPSSSCATCATPTAGCCAPTTSGRAQPERLPRGPRVPARGAADAVRGDVRPALVRRGARARRRDPRPLRRPRARRLLLHGRRPRGADRPPQGPRGHADPVAAARPPRSGCCGSRG